MKSVNRARLVKTASHAVSAKNAFANCASHWMPLQLPQLPLQSLPKSVQLASLAKNASHVRHAKSVNHVPSRPKRQPPAKKKCCPTKSKRRRKARTTPKANVHVVVPVVNVVAAIAASVSVMPMAM